MPKDSHTDPNLIGDWLDKNDQETYRITTAKESPWMHVEVIKAGAKTDSYDFYSTTLGKNTFANVIVLNESNPAMPPKAYTFVRYSVSKAGILKMWSLSPDKIADAVRSGKLKGTVSKDKDPDVYLTDDSAVLAKFIQSSDVDKLFTNEATLTKVDTKEK